MDSFKVTAQTLGTEPLWLTFHAPSADEAERIARRMLGQLLGVEAGRRSLPA